MPVSRTHKIGSQGAHTIQTKLLKNSATPIIITGDSTAAGLRRYGHVWLNYFRDALNSGVNDDRLENVLWWARDISFPRTTSFAIIHCGTNNMEKISTKRYCSCNHKNYQSLQEVTSKNKYHHYWYVTRGTGILFSASKNRLDKADIKSEIKNLPQTYFMDEDDDWVKNDMMPNENFYFKDFLQLVETGNDKFSNSICF